MSAPAPETVNTPPDACADPVTPTAPTSNVDHPGGSAPLMATLSNVAVAVRVASWLDTANPTYTDDAMEKVSRATTVHVAPSADAEAVIVWPLLVSFTQCGAAPDTMALLVDVPPV